MTDERLKEIKHNIDYEDLHIRNTVYLKEKKELYNEVIRLREIIDNIKEYVNYLVIFNQTINGKFSETQWGEDILDLLRGEDK